VRFSPPAGTRIVLVKGTSCEIDFTVDVLKGPGDRNPTTFGGDIRQVTSHGQFGGPLDPASDSSRAQSSSLGFGTALFRGLPFLNASASPSATLGGQVSATATVVGRHNQLSGGTTDFRLYAPEDQACRSAPVFESLGVPYPADGGAVASQAFAPDRAGLYRWVVTYSGDVGNFPAISMCGGTNVIVRAPSQATPSQPPPPTCSGRTATIVASPGQRSIKGTAGADVIVGGALGERIDGGAGDDTICAGAGDDVVRGGAGKDVLLGGAGRDRLLGGSGNDRIEAAGGGSDRLDCGPGRGDSVLMDRRDRSTRCERVRRSK
jgi:hypothetical protein